MSSVSKAFQENDDAIKHLLRQVVYMFYPHQSIIIMEAILFHNVLFEDDLIKLCCMHKKVFRTFCNKLIDDKLIISHSQKEETQPYKYFNRTYYFIHNIEAIDSIKWKIHKIVKHVKEEIGNFSEPQGYICPTCHHKYTLLDAASLLTDDRLNFECSICGDYLIDDDISKEQRKGQEKLERLMSLVEPIIKYLKIVDDLKIDDNNFDTTLIKYVPAFSDSLALYSVSTKSSSRRKKFDNSNNGQNLDINQKSQATILVSITADDEDLKRERQRREDRNKKLRENTLPSWHQESTVGKAALGRLDSEDEEMAGIENNNQDLSSTDPTNPTDPTDPTTTSTTTTDGQTLIPDITVKMENSIQSESEHSTNNVKLEFSDNESTVKSNSTNTNPIANIKLESDSVISKQKKNPQSSIPSISSIPGISDSTSAEEFDALSAYYSQLRQRQEAEEEAEEEEDEEEEEEIGDIDMDDVEDDSEEGNDVLIKGDENVIKNNKELTSDGKNNVQDEGKFTSNEQPTTTATAEDFDEEDFDLEMFASDDE